MAGLKGKAISTVYKSILRVNDDTNGIDTASEVVTDGEGTSSALRLSDDTLTVRPNNDNTTATFNVSNTSGSSLLSVDSTNSIVKAGANAINVHTNYMSFQMNSGWWSGALANNWYPLCFTGNNNAITIPTFGTSTYPASSFTTAEGSGTRSAELVPFLWYIIDAIKIEAVNVIEGADTATGDTTRFNLWSYDFNSGSTSCLTNGAIIGYNSDTTNAGSEQAYNSAFTISNANVSAGKVVMGFLRADSVNSDYSANIYIKYSLQ